jgi:hypothetical protein
MPGNSTGSSSNFGRNCVCGPQCFLISMKESETWKIERKAQYVRHSNCVGPMRFNNIELYIYRYLFKQKRRNSVNARKKYR